MSSALKKLVLKLHVANFFRVNLVRTGFTLLELILVISLIVVISTIWISNFPGAQKSAKDARRREDLETYRSALELYANANNGLYPVATTTTLIDTVNGQDTDAPCPQLRTVINNEQYLAQCPVDPRNFGHTIYKYKTNAAGTNYCMWTKLERSVTDGMVECYKTCSDGTSGTWPVTIGQNCPEPL